jgi:hypothetical protein
VTGTLYAAVFYLGSAMVAVWLVARFPAAAPSSLMFRAVAPITSSFAIQNVRVDTSDWLHLYVTLFLVAFPLLVVAWVTALWLLQMLRDVVVRP